MKFLQYPGCLGNTSLALSRVLEKFKKDGVREIVSPFLTDGKFEIAMADFCGIHVKSSTDSQHVFDLWCAIKTQRSNLIDKTIDILRDGNGDRFYFAAKAIDRYSIEDKIEKSALMVAMNMLARNGGSMRADRKNQFFSDYDIVGSVLYKVDGKGQKIYYGDIKDLSDLSFRNIKIEKKYFCDAIKDIQNEHLFVYPPSMLYPRPVQGEFPEQMENFPHNILHGMLHSRDNWTLLAEDDGVISSDFAGCEVEIIRSQRVTDVYDLLLISK